MNDDAPSDPSWGGSTPLSVLPRPDSDSFTIDDDFFVLLDQTPPPFQQVKVPRAETAGPDPAPREPVTPAAWKRLEPVDVNAPLAAIEPAAAGTPPNDPAPGKLRVVSRDLLSHDPLLDEAALPRFEPTASPYSERAAARAARRSNPLDALYVRSAAPPRPAAPRRLFGAGVRAAAVLCVVALVGAALVHVVTPKAAAPRAQAPAEVVTGPLNSAQVPEAAADRSVSPPMLALPPAQQSGPPEVTSRAGALRPQAPEIQASVGETGTVVLSNGEEITGRYAEFTADLVVLRFHRGVMRLPVEDIKGLRRADGTSFWRRHARAISAPIVDRTTRERLERLESDFRAAGQ